MLRALLHYFAIGAVLFAAKVAIGGGEGNRPEVTVVMPAGASGADIEKETRNQILLNEARRYGWYRTDPVVFTHLVRNMRFIDPETTDDDATLFEQALAMNMQEHDPVVRARLLYRAREALGFVPEDQLPTTAELEQHRIQHPDRFEREGKVRFEHVFLSGTRRGESLGADGAQMRETLDALGEAPPAGLGDPLPGLRAVQSTTVSDVENNYGKELAAVVDEAIAGVWRGPLPSVYGLHFVRVLEKAPPTLPPLSSIEAEVRADYLTEVRKRLSDERMNALRDAYVVQVETVQ
ncbi:MAG: peptidylprolyl isomerase [Myxococcota bacterium]